MAVPEYNFEDLIDSLGNLTDTQLETLGAAIHETRQARHRLEARKLRGQINVGDILRIRSNCKPKYLAGQPVEILAFKNSRVQLKLVNGPRGKFRQGTLLAPITLLEQS